jgi:hypothetical protein
MKIKFPRTPSKQHNKNEKGPMVRKRRKIGKMVVMENRRQLVVSIKIE